MTGEPGRLPLRLIGMCAIRTLAAAACVAALSACTTTTAPTQRPPAGVPMGASMSSPGAMPRYYVVVAGLTVAVRASGDGHVTGSVPVPVAGESGRAFVGAEVFGGADDQRFVIVVSRGGDLPGVADCTVYLLSVTPGGKPGRLRRLNFDSHGTPVIGAALSPDGTMVALSLAREFPGEPLYGTVALLSAATGATGATRTWTAQAAPGYWPGIPAWVGGSTVMVPWWHDVGRGMLPAAITGVRELDVAAPGRSLLAAPLVAFSAPVQGLESAVIAPGGGDLIASSCRAGHHAATAQVTELSTAEGRLVRVLRAQAARFRNDADAQDAVFSTCRVLSVAGDGGHALVQSFAFGRIDNGAFTPLPGTSPGVLPVSAAW